MPMRDKPSLAGGLAYLFALVVVLSLFFHVYFIESGGDESLLWNANEVYLFIHGEHFGYHVSYLGLAVGIAKSYFGVVDDPDENRPKTETIRLKASRVDL
jgi:hypothetical protein